jgi:predicted unusual protein kinase regulating ubiquinone biosynthesis (AarF/ABC1/UbiB family)
MARQKRIPRGKLARGGVVGVTAARVGAKKAGQAVRRPFLSGEQRRSLDHKTDAEVARIVFNALAHLRGTALKAAQLIAMEMELLPEAYRRELSRASSEVPPMNRALVRKVVVTELGPPERIFASFDPIPFAAASLGQVHAAARADGLPLAVKVQYPGIAEGVTSDIALLRGVLAPTRLSRIFHDCFDEIDRKIKEELDYRREVDNTIRFRSLSESEDLIFPAVIDELSTGRVLTTSRLDGLHLGAWLEKRPSQAERDHYGQLLVDFFHRSTYQTRIIHADPNPGNYLFRDDGRLGIIDFGCVKELDSSLVRTIAAFTNPDERPSPSTLEQLLGEIGIFYKDTDDPGALTAFLTRWIDWIREPYLREQFDFSRDNDYFARGASLGAELYPHLDRYDGTFIYYGRTWHGLLRLLQQLGARVRMSAARWADFETPAC